MCQGAQIRAIWEFCIFLSSKLTYEANFPSINICRKSMNAQNGLKFPSDLCFGIMNATKYSYLLNSKVGFLKSGQNAAENCPFFLRWKVLVIFVRFSLGMSSRCHKSLINIFCNICLFLNKRVKKGDYRNALNIIERSIHLTPQYTFDREQCLELRQYKNDSMKSICMLVLKLPLFFPHRIGEWKRVAISKQTYLLTP